MKRIHISNFRCYRDLTVNFKPGVNLLIGDNASGKTSLLKAAKYVVSSFFAGFSDENTVLCSPEDADFTEEVVDGLILPERPISIGFAFDKRLFDDVESSKMCNNPGCVELEQAVVRKNKKNRKVLVSNLSVYRDYARCLQEQFIDEQGRQVRALPLWAMFSTEDIHTTRKVQGRKFLQYAQKSSMGYYECLNSNGLLPYWQKRLLALQEAGQRLYEVEIVKAAISSALGKDGCGIITGMIIRLQNSRVFYTFTDGREVETAKLSDGYRRLVNIVTDLAIRCAMLNFSIYKEDAYKFYKRHCSY